MNKKKIKFFIIFELLSVYQPCFIILLKREKKRKEKVIL